MLNEIFSPELINVLVSILIASSIGAGLIYFFMWVGSFAALDERIFPRITFRQQAFFAFAGFYLLFLSAIEVLNPLSLYTLRTQLSLTFKPSFLGHSVISDISTQDVFSIFWLIGLVGLFLTETIVYSRKAFEKDRKAIPPLQQYDISESRDDQMKKKTKGLWLAYSFSAVSFIIALISPALATSWKNNLGLIAILGVFLISGVYCFIEAIKLGAFFSKRRDEKANQWVWVFIHVIGPAIFLYLGIGTLGYFLYVILPGYFITLQSIGNNDLLDVIRSVTKIVAGVFVVLAAYLVAWGTDGLSKRIVEFMVTVALIPLVLPLFTMLWEGLIVAYLHAPKINLDSPTSISGILYACIVLVLPIAAFRFGRQSRSSGKFRIGYIKDISWIPLSMTNVSNKYECMGYSSTEELLDEMTGQTARTGRKKLLPLPLRYQIANLLGFYKDFDAIILDITSAIRLLDIINKQSRTLWQRGKSGRYFIVAGICKSKDVCLKVERPGKRQSPIVAYAGAPYLPKNIELFRLISKGVKSWTGKKKPPRIELLPPNCSSDFLAQPYNYLILPEPFATDFRMKSKKLGTKVVTVKISGNNQYSWLFDHYFVLMVKDLSNIELVKNLSDSIVSGVDQLKHLRGPAAAGAPALAAAATELDPGDRRELDSLSVALSTNTLGLDDLAIIGSATPLGKPNWEFLKNRLEKLRDERIVTLSEEQLREVCNCTIIGRNYA